MNNLPFNYKKSVQAVNFFALKNGGNINKLYVLKLIYFADRFHLRKYGRPITNDQYWAMQYGPVASSVKEIVELDALGAERHYAKEFLRKGNPNAGEQEFIVKSEKPVDDNIFSESDVEALEFAWNTFGQKLLHLVNITHKYPEWKNHETALNSEHTRVQMNYLDFFDDPEPGCEPCCTLDEEEREARRNVFREVNEIENLWR